MTPASRYRHVSSSCTCQYSMTIAHDTAPRGTKYTSRHAVCVVEDSVPTPSGEAFAKTPVMERRMESISQMPIVVAAIQYSLVYLLLGGGLFGAIVIYIVAKVLGK